MKAKAHKNSADRGKTLNFILSSIKGGLVSVLAAFVLIVIFALVIKLTNLSEEWFQPVTQVIKGIALIIGICSAMKGEKPSVFIGTLAGIIFTLLAFTLFSVIDDGFNFSLNLIYDLLFGAGGGTLIALMCKIAKK